MTSHVLVMMGGVSVERAVSLVSGAQCAAALRDAGYRVSEVDVGEDLAPVLATLRGSHAEGRPDIVFNALHGRYGEDGRMQGLLDLLHIPYTHSGVLASALAMHKPTSLRLFAEAGVPVADGVVADRANVIAGRVMDRPYVVKPLNEGSSVNVYIVGENEPLPFVGDHWPFDDDAVLVERYVAGRELTVAVMSANGVPAHALAVTDIHARGAFYDYTAKYVEGRSIHHVPAKIDPQAYDAALAHAITAHDTLGCRGVSRADFRYDDTTGEPGQLVMLEVNTQPGMTPVSLVPEQAAHCGMSFTELVVWLVEHAACD